MPAPITTQLAFVGKSFTLVPFASHFRFDVTTKAFLDDGVQTYSVIRSALPPWCLVSTCTSILYDGTVPQSETISVEFKAVHVRIVHPEGPESAEQGKGFSWRFLVISR